MAFQFTNSIYDKAKKNVKTIAIPEVTNEYMIKAAAKATADGPFYMYMDCSHPDKKMYIDGEYRQIYFNRFYRNLVYLGDYKKGQTVTIELRDDHDSKTDHHVLVKTLNMPVFEKMIATFQDSAWDLKEFSDGNVKATISSDKRRLCMTTVPYDPDWTVRVNGKSVKTKSVVNGMMAFHVPKGKSTITMHYRLAGQKKGIAITIVSLLVFFGWQYIAKKRFYLAKEETKEIQN